MMIKENNGLKNSSLKWHSGSQFRVHSQKRYGSLSLVTAKMNYDVSMKRRFKDMTLDTVGPTGSVRKPVLVSTLDN